MTAAQVGDPLVITRTAVRLLADRVAVDVTDFEALLARPDPSSLQRGVALYRDDFLVGFSLRGCPEFEQWQSRTADRLRQLLAGGLERLVGACEGAGQLHQALVHARRWLDLDPLHEPAHQRVIGLLASTGQRADAIQQYRELVRVLDRELAVRPLPATTRLYDDVRAGRVGPAPGTLHLTSGLPPGYPGPGTMGASGQLSGSTPADPAQDPSWPMVGRADALGALSRAWRGVARAGSVVAVCGEAGAGKSRLVTEFRAQVEAAGARVIGGRCHEGESGLPYALAVDLLHSAASACPDLPDRIAEHVAAMVGRLAPDLARAFRDVPSPPLSGVAAMTRLYAAVGTTVLAAARSGQGPGVVVVEDAHWADGPSLDLLAYLTRRLADWPLLLVVSWRPEQADGVRGLALAVAEAADSGHGHRLEPAPLSVEEIAQVLHAARVPHPDPARMLTETRGLPLLVREYAQALVAAGPLDQGAGGEGRWSPPATVRELMSRRMQAASPAALQLLTATAVLGGGADPELLRAVSGRGRTETLESLDEAVARFLLTEVPPAGDGDSPSYEFPYQALRRVAYESASLARRRLLHGRAADALAATYSRDPSSARAAVVAGHLQQAGRDPESAQWWWQAGMQARQLFAHAEAYAHLRQALALGYPQVTGSLALGEVLTVLGRYHEALAAYETGASAGDGTGVLAATLEHKLAEVHHRLGDWDLAQAHLGAAADLLAPDDFAARARVEADRAVVAFRRGDDPAAAVFAAAARQDAARAGEPAALAQAFNVAGMLAARDGDAEAAEEHLRTSLEQARALADHAGVSAALNNLARLLADTDRLPEALACATEALARGSELGDTHRVAALHTNLADLLHASGQREASLEHLKEAARRFASVDPGAPPRAEIWTLVEW